MSDQLQLFPLTDEEWRERAKRLASLVGEYKRLEDQKKTAMREFNGTLKELRGEAEKLAEAVSSGKEWRDLLDGDAPWMDR